MDHSKPYMALELAETLDSACGFSATCSRRGLRGPGMECCPARDGTFLACCALECSFDGIHCLPVGRSDVLADQACALRLSPDGKSHFDLSDGAGDMLCQSGGGPLR